MLHIDVECQTGVSHMANTQTCLLSCLNKWSRHVTSASWYIS